MYIYTKSADQVDFGKIIILSLYLISPTAEVMTETMLYTIDRSLYLISYTMGFITSKSSMEP